MPNKEITLPSGAKGIVRGLKGAEINLFANAQAARRGRTAMELLKNVWVKTLDSGPLHEGDSIDWDEAPKCDRFYALFCARIATYGKEYAFPHQCTDLTCRKTFEWVEDLEKLPVTALPEKSIVCFKDNNRFSTEVMDNETQTRKVIFQLLTPKIEGKVEQVQSLAPTEKATASLSQRIVSIAGIGEEKADIKKFFADLDAGTLYDLIYEMDLVDGGIETEIQIECPHCGNIMEEDLPLLAAFWSPVKRKRSTKT